MAILTRDQIMDLIKQRSGEDTSDETLKFIEDVGDTLANMEQLSAEGASWKAKYEENDASWRQKYKDRFFNSDVREDLAALDKQTKNDPEDDRLTFDKLFKTEEKK